MRAPRKRADVQGSALPPAPESTLEAPAQPAPTAPARRLEAIAVELQGLSSQLDVALERRQSLREIDLEIAALHERMMALRAEADAAFAARFGLAPPATPAAAAPPPAGPAPQQEEDLGAIHPKVRAMLAAQLDAQRAGRPPRPDADHYWDSDANDWLFDPEQARAIDAREAQLRGAQ